MSQVNSVKDLRNKQAKCLVQNRGKTSLIDIKSSSYPRPRTTVEYFLESLSLENKYLSSLKHSFYKLSNKAFNMFADFLNCLKLK